MEAFELVRLFVNKTLISIIVVGIVTFLLSFLGVFAGKRFGNFFGKRIETLGGLILIGIGIKILVTFVGFDL